MIWSDDDIFTAEMAAEVMRRGACEIAKRYIGRKVGEVAAAEPWAALAYAADRLTPERLDACAAALNAAVADRARCPYLRDGERLIVVWSDGSVEPIENWPWLVKDGFETGGIDACFALRLSPFETRDLLGTLRLARDAYRDAEPMGADDATMRAVRASVRAGL